MIAKARVNKMTWQSLANRNTQIYRSFTKHGAKLVQGINKSCQSQLLHVAEMAVHQNFIAILVEVL